MVEFINFNVKFVSLNVEFVINIKTQYKFDTHNNYNI